MSSTEILLPVFGMSCHNCERKVEAGIDELAGVSWSKADHKENSLCVKGAVSVAALQQQILDLGYQLTPEVAARFDPEQPVSSYSDVPGFNLDVSGMSCASCVRSVERALLASPDVVQAVVNYAGGTAFVRSHGGQQSLLDALAGAGYPGRPHSDDLDEQERRIKSDFSAAVFRSGLALAAGIVF
ncbi:MAG: cation transporter, partial [Gammaproteobacteria bacterium]|nr:cation transporter [Gammaproteobacteria bacterium]